MEGTQGAVAAPEEEALPPDFKIKSPSSMYITIEEGDFFMEYTTLVSFLNL